MHKDRLNNEVQALERKVRILLTKHQQLLQENEQLKAENKDLKSHLSSKDNQLSDFQNKLNINSIVRTIESGKTEVNEEVKNKIDHFIGEIDKCIQYLSK